MHHDPPTPDMYSSSPPTAPNVPLNLPAAKIVGEYVNVVGHDQINVTNIHMSPDSCPGQHLLFNNLSHVVKASYDASTPALRRVCTENTRAGVLDAIKDWALDATKPKIYWMNGKAGTGKTTIAYTFSVFLETHKILGATFFCSRLVDECTKVDRIFPTIAYHLAQNYPPLAITILEALKHDPDAAHRTINRQLTDLLVRPIRSAAETLSGPIIVIIDALDECANQADVRTLLLVLFQRSSELPFKIFITSRPEQSFRVGFNRQNPNSYATLVLHDIERDIVNADIKLYLYERLLEMVDGRSDFEDSEDDWPPEDKVNVLVHKSNRLFIYAKTVCDYIEEHGGNISERLDVASSEEDLRDFPGDSLDTTELDRLYRDILNRAIPNRPKDHVRLKSVLSAIISIRNPLSARALGILLAIHPGAVKSTLGSLHAVISVPQSLGSPVSTFHASFPDFLADPNRSHHHFLPPSKSHQLLAKSCLTLLNTSLKENICGLDGYPPNDTIASEMIMTHVPDGLAYACIYWASHLTAVRNEEVRDAEDVRQLLDEFLREHVLHWMECLSLLGRLDTTSESLRTIEGWALGLYPEMSSMITDARRFILENFELISQYCLETYHSALVWLPKQSIIRIRYASQRHDLPRVVIGLRDTWGSCEKVIICGSRVYSVAFSSDGFRVVSGLYDQTIRIWNAVTGEPEGIFIGHEGRVLSVAFSRDGSLVVSGSDDETVRIWNTLGGVDYRVLRGHSGAVLSVAFSSDGSRVVSGSRSGEIRMWNVATCELEGNFERIFGPVNTVTFSSDGTLVVSGFGNGTVQISNAATGRSERILDRHSHSVLSVSLSSDGSHVVSGSEDKTVRISNAVTGELEHILEGHSDWVLSVAFSRDGRVLSGSRDGTFRVWNETTGELKSEGLIEGHSCSITSMAFSSDWSRVVSGSLDETIRICSTASGESEGALVGHSESVSTVSFSSDGSRVVSGSNDNMIRIWNAVAGELERTLVGHSSWVTSVAISSDGCRIASCSLDKTVRIWDTVTGDSKVVIKVEDSVSSVAFSSDSSQVVSASSDDKVRVYNAMTGELEDVLEGNSQWMTSVAFSRVGSRVVSGSDQTSKGKPRNLLFVQLSDQAERRHEPDFELTVPAQARDPSRCLFHHRDSSAAWIQTSSARRGCWIPHRYRDFHRTHCCGLKIFFGFRSGSVVLLDFTNT